MKLFCRGAIVVIFVLPLLLTAQPAYEIIGLEGTAKIQRVQKQKWEKLNPGDKISDNDIVETFFQTKLTVQFGEGNCAIFGSNTKAILTLTAKEVAGGKIFEANISIFNGGLFVKAIAKTHVGVFSTNAVAEMDSGAMAVIVDAKTGETGALVLGGKAVARTIAQQKGRELTVGLTTILLPGREPAPPLYLSYRHVAVLKHFFGDEYISDELQASSITPSDDRSSVSRISLSQGFSTEQKKTDDLFYKRLFNINKIYGSILADREANEAPYAPVARPSSVSDHAGSVAFSTGLGSAGARTVWHYTLAPSFHMPYFAAVLRFPLYDTYYSRYIYGYNSPRGIFDKFQQITGGSIDESLFLTAGTLSGITLGNGLIVDEFRNTDNNRFFHPLGLRGTAALFNKEITVDAFLADVAGPSLGGFHVSFEPSMYYLGAGYYFDLDPYRHVRDTEDLRYTGVAPRGHLFPDTAIVQAGIGIYELSIGTLIAQTYGFSSRVQFEFAQKRLNGASDGCILKMPSFLFGWPRFSFGGGFLMESGRIVSREFNEFYCSRRSYLKCSDAGPTAADTLLTYNTSLWKRRSSNAFFVSFGANPVRGSDISVEYTQNFRAKNSYAVWIEDSTTDSIMITSPGDFSLDCRLAFKKQCIPYLRYGSLYFRQIHGGLFPRGGTLFLSWNTEAGFECVTEPLFFNLSLETGGRMFFLDKGPRPNDAINRGELIKEWSAGIRWSFK